MVPHRLTAETIDSEAALRELIGEPAPIVCAKISDRLNALTRKFIELSPFLCLATSDETGSCDVSPRGDPPGFVRILDDVTLLIPERPGNRIADSLRNILRNPHVGLVFFVPGVTDTFRVNGKATLTRDASLLRPCAVEGKISKAFLRSHLWDASRFVDRSQLPTNGEIHRALQGDGFDAASYDAERAARYARREGFY